MAAGPMAGAMAAVAVVVASAQGATAVDHATAAGGVRAPDRASVADRVSVADHARDASGAGPVDAAAEWSKRRPSLALPPRDGLYGPGHQGLFTGPVTGRGHGEVFRGRFVPVADDDSAPALTHAPELVPGGAGIEVLERADDDGVTVGLRVRGLVPHRTYGAHVHTRPCGADPEDSGPHYQDRVDPVQPSADPAYANPRNEVWLDVTTDAHGHAEAVSHNRWWFRKGEARSVVLHEHATGTGHGRAGMAGPRLACFSVPFGELSDGARASGGTPSARPHLRPYKPHKPYEPAPWPARRDEAPGTAREAAPGAGTAS
ncbi:hypothetical protein [Streptomyces sp. URMC 123]|uniref:hypothetical protein n=1 Tax=Streptomyces sp. URMC 123 TaxID=3423403 RepID=UPI003F1BB510